VCACRRPQALQKTLDVLHACEPPADEIIVHLDGNSEEIRSLLANQYPSVRVLLSDELMGPGGARNRLNRESTCPWIAHFDDDSYPDHPEFFATAKRLLHSAPEIAVWCATIVSHEKPLAKETLWLQAVYPGCGHIMNQAWFQRTEGYQQRTVAYNFEEVDVSLQLLEIKGRCVQSADLRVWHDHPTPLHESPEWEVEVLLNTILFPVVRYPVAMFPQALLSILRRCCSIAFKPSGIWILLQTLKRLPSELERIMSVRNPVSISTTFSWLRLRRCPELLSLSSG
jgi:GT2 family glycosyltransferase